MQPDRRLSYRTEKLSPQEIRKLRLRMISVWIFGISIAGFSCYFIFGSLMSETHMKTPLILFSVFFYGILFFILTVHTVNAFRTEKRIYTGLITDKKTQASTMRNSSLNEHYSIALDGEWFGLELQYFQKVHTGDEVEIHTFGAKQVFNVVKLSGPTIHTEEKSVLHKETDLYLEFPGMDEKLTETDRALLWKSLLQAFLLRGVAGLCGAYVLYEVLAFAIVITMLFGLKGAKREYLVFIHYAAMSLSALAFLLVNRKTFRLMRDYAGDKKLVKVETIVDLVQSTHRKPGPNSIVSGNYNSEAAYFYIQTENHWLMVDEMLFRAAKAGDKLKIHLGPRSKTILRLSL